MKKAALKNLIKGAGSWVARLSLGIKLLTVLCLTVAISLLIEQNYAWHADNHAVRQMDVNISSDTTDLSLTGYSFYYGALQYDEHGLITGAVGTRSDGSGEQSMNPYDAVIGSNTYTPVYYKISLSGSRFAGAARPPITLSIGRSNGNVLPTDPLGHYYTETNAAEHWTSGKTALYLSNIVGVRWTQLDSIATEGSAPAIYTALQNAGTWNGAGSEPYSFITPIPEARGRFTELSEHAEKSQNIEITINEYETTVVDGVDTVIIYLRIDYCQPLIEVYLNENYASLSGRLNQTITESFAADITSISIS